MLMPRKTKFRRHHRGHRRGQSTGQTTVQFGEYGLKALEAGWISNRQIEAARIAATRKIRRSGKVWINPRRWFAGVPKAAWDFHVGGYRVCERWLRDRRGRVLGPEDVAHYQRVVAALGASSRLMAQVDRAIEAHGGWPAAFSLAGGRAGAV